jgi:hypothetical protein
MIKFIAERLNFVKLCDNNGLFGAEIGVWKGENAENILKNLPINTLYLIDPYTPYIDGDKRNIEVVDPSPHYKTALNRLEPYIKDTTIIFKLEKSVDAAKTMPPNILDFVYIDGDHTYENVSQELEAFYPLVESGGVLGGHDINFYGVMKAVGEFAEKHRLHPMTDKQDWWIVKP